MEIIEVIIVILNGSIVLVLNLLFNTVVLDNNVLYHFILDLFLFTYSRPTF